MQNIINSIERELENQAKNLHEKEIDRNNLCEAVSINQKQMHQIKDNIQVLSLELQELKRTYYSEQRKYPATTGECLSPSRDYIDSLCSGRSDIEMEKIKASQKG